MIRRKSKQRDKIYEIIKSTSSHPTALWIFNKIKKEIPSISKGNVYRNIRILVEENKIQSKIFDDGIEHYDTIVDQHYHFICDNYRKISDFEFPIQKQIIQMAQKKYKAKNYWTYNSVSRVV